MSNSKKGKAYEAFVEKVFELFSLSDKYEAITRNVRLNTRHGKREIDILLTQSSDYFDLRVAVECKDQKAKVSIGVVEVLSSKMKDAKAHKGIIVSRSGFSSNALSKARELGISMFVVDELDREILGIEPEIPVLFKQFGLKNRGEGTSFNFELGKDQNPSFQLGELAVNDKSIFSWIREKWENHEFDLHHNTDMLYFTFPELEKKYIRDKFGQKIELNDFKIEAKLDIKYFYGLIPVGDKGYLLSQLEKGQTDIIFPFNEIPDFKHRLSWITEKEAQALEGLQVFGIVQRLS